jgi:hypothetical protein
MDFREQLTKAADEAVKNNQRMAEHLIRQAFYDGVRFYMNYARQNPLTGVPPKAEA